MQKMNFKVNVYVSDTEKVDSPYGENFEGSKIKMLQDQVALFAIEKALIYTGGNRLQAGRILGVHRNTVAFLFKKLSTTAQNEIAKLSRRNGRAK